LWWQVGACSWSRRRDVAPCGKEATLQRRLLVALVELAAMVVLVALATAATAATTRSDGSRAKTIASYCSSSGDVCFGIFNRDGRVLFKLTTAARYFSRYTVCATRLPRGKNPEHAQRCGSFPLFRQSRSTWGSSVDFAKQFVGPASHPSTPLDGRYQVTWRQVCSDCTAKARRHSDGGRPLGPSLFFRHPLS
jgi:hypothetical protein